MCSPEFNPRALGAVARASQQLGGRHRHLRHRSTSIAREVPADMLAGERGASAVVARLSAALLTSPPPSSTVRRGASRRAKSDRRIPPAWRGAMRARRDDPRPGRQSAGRGEVINVVFCSLRRGASSSSFSERRLGRCARPLRTPRRVCRWRAVFIVTVGGFAVLGLGIYRLLARARPQPRAVRDGRELSDHRRRSSSSKCSAASC